MNSLSTNNQVAVLAIALFLPMFSQANNIDCKKATKKIEKLICSDSKVLELDSELSKLYISFLGSIENKKEFKKEQRKWTKEQRNQCKNVSCLNNIYIERISVLKLSASSISNSEINSPDINISKLNSSIKPSELYTFERLLSGFETCDLKDVHIDPFTRAPVNPYFIDRELKPDLLNDDMAVYSVKEIYHGLPVYKVVLPHEFPVFAIYIDAPIEVVIEKLTPFLEKGFYSEFPNVETFEKPLIMMDESDPRKTSLTCD